jgi:hypothetical protein
VLNNLGYGALIRGDPASARDWLEQGLEISVEIEEIRLIATGHYNLGSLALELNDMQQARREFWLGLECAQRFNDPLWISYGLNGLACAAESEAVEQAVKLAAAVQTTIDRLGAPLDLVERRQNERLLERSREALGQETFEAAWRAGSISPWNRLSIWHRV